MEASQRAKRQLSSLEKERSDLTESPKQQSDSGCYDLIGDVHGYLDLLDSLAEQLGYSKKGKSYEHPEGRKLIFVGDLINRGPASIGV